MTKALADTSFFVAILNPGDADHAAALAWSQREDLTVVVTEFVLVELGNFLAKAPQRERLPGLVAFLRNNPRAMIVPVSSALFDSGLDLYARRPDKTWSLTDCISFVVMKEQGLTGALTADHHFGQAGFTALLR